MAQTGPSTLLTNSSAHAGVDPEKKEGGGGGGGE